ncbi:MAG TPA: pyrroline-5-carboxylate reductase [Solirubrobacteraceae bacterium]|jgi:pyrroline-5-carboxylate reductase
MLGLIGAGNMARALARGWGEPVLATDSGSGRAQALVDELGGEVVASNADLVERADVVVLAHKPHQLDAVAQDAAGGAPGKLVVSVLAGTPLERLAAAWPGANVVRAMPNTPVEVQAGVTIIAEGDGADEARALFERVGRVFVLPEALLDVATATTGVAPAYVALIAEAQIDAAVKQGLPAPLAAEMFVATLIGSAQLIAARDHDTLAVRREVTSPGGSTARGVAALERNRLRSAFAEAMAAVLGR